MNIPKDAQEDFERYCIGLEGSVPPKDSADWNRLAGAFLAYRRASELERSRYESPDKPIIPHSSFN